MKYYGRCLKQCGILLGVQVVITAGLVLWLKSIALPLGSWELAAWIGGIFFGADAIGCLSTITTGDIDYAGLIVGLAAGLITALISEGSIFAAIVNGVLAGFSSFAASSFIYQAQLRSRSPNNWLV